MKTIHHSPFTIHHLLYLCIIIFIFNSCSENNVLTNHQEEVNTVDYKKLDIDLKNYAESFKKHFASEASIKEFADKHFKPKTQDSNVSNVFTLGASHEINTLDASDERTTLGASNEKTSGVTTQEVYIDMPAHYSDRYAHLMLAFYNDMVNAYDHEIPEILNNYQSRLDNGVIVLSIDETNQFQTLLNASKYVTQALGSVYNMDGTKVFIQGLSGNCSPSGFSRSIGRGMVSGGVGGAVAGLLGGGLAGVLPGLAAGAIGGGVVGAVEAAMDCLETSERVVENNPFLGPDGNPVAMDGTLLGLDDDTRVELKLNP